MTATKHSITISGRVLFLCDDSDLIERQLKGESLSLADARPLRDSISTDEITPLTVMVIYDEKLGRYPYLGYKVGGKQPIGENAIKNGGFEVTVGGKRYGKGSSRESSPLAELSAGIRVIVAESFERIYQQNCDNIGVLTTTDFSVLDLIAAEKPIPMERFLQGRDEVTKDIIRAGGLLKYSKTRTWPVPVPREGVCGDQPRTLAEKIIERHLHPDIASSAPGQGVFLAADWRFSHDYFTGMAAHLMHQAFGRPATLFDPDSIIAFQDHLALAAQSHVHVTQGLLPGIANLSRGHTDFASSYPVRSHGDLKGVPGSEGICHAMMAEKYALPGQLIAGTDSHTPHSGALGCLAFGVGSSDMAISWVTGYTRCKVPQTLRVEVEGELRPGVVAKDVVLYLLQTEQVRSGAAIGLIFEYGGSAVRAMSVDERATLTNMVAELGGFTGIVEPDDKVEAFLMERRGLHFKVQPWMRSDEGASYKDTIRIDATKLSPMVARPGDPGNGMGIEDLAEPVAVDIAYGGSCTGGKRADFDQYHEVMAWGLKHGRKVASNTRLYLQFGTMDVREYCMEQGYMETFEKAGAEIIMPGCGACANCGPGSSISAEQVTVSAINRNFPGRSGPGSVYLASPYTVAASALAGRLSSFDDLKRVSSQ